MCVRVCVNEADIVVGVPSHAAVYTVDGRKSQLTWQPLTSHTRTHTHTHTHLIDEEHGRDGLSVRLKDVLINLSLPHLG